MTTRRMTEGIRIAGGGRASRGPRLRRLHDALRRRARRWPRSGWSRVLRRGLDRPVPRALRVRRRGRDF